MSTADELVRIVIVDDDPLVSASLRTILGTVPFIDVLACGASGEEAVDRYEALRPDVLLLDIRMPGMGGLAAAERILSAHPHARVVFLTTFSDDDYIVRALRLGARGYLIKQDVATIPQALRAVMAGQVVFGPEVCERMDALLAAPRTPVDSRGHAEFVADATPAAPSPRSRSLLADLTDRERDIAALVAEGMDNREIGGALYLSEGTVRNHISTILQKLNLKNRTQLAVTWWREQS